MVKKNQIIKREPNLT